MKINYEKLSTKIEEAHLNLVSIKEKILLCLTLREAAKREFYGDIKGRNLEVLNEIIEGNTKVDDIAEKLGMSRSNTFRCFRLLEEKHKIKLTDLGVKKAKNRGKYE